MPIEKVQRILGDTRVQKTLAYTEPLDIEIIAAASAPLRRGRRKNQGSLRIRLSEPGLKFRAPLPMWGRGEARPLR
jgi:hypothetical protein